VSSACGDSGRWRWLHLQLSSLFSSLSVLAAAGFFVLVLVFNGERASKTSSLVFDSDRGGGGKQAATIKSKQTRSFSFMVKGKCQTCGQ